MRLQVGIELVLLIPRPVLVECLDLGTRVLTARDLLGTGPVLIDVVAEPDHEIDVVPLREVLVADEEASFVVLA